MLQDIFLKISIFVQNFSLFLVVLLLFFYLYAFGQEKQKIFTQYKALQFRARYRRVGHTLVTLFLLLFMAKRVEIEKK